MRRIATAMTTFQNAKSFNACRLFLYKPYEKLGFRKLRWLAEANTRIWL